MNLELDILNIEDVRFGEKTMIRDGILAINQQEFQDLLRQDNRFGNVEIELSHPGDNCRIVQVFDVIEPRAKTGGTGENYPGALGKIQIAGEGRTLALKGSAIVTIDFTAGASGDLIDMSGPGAETGDYGKLQNVILLCSPAEGIERTDYQNALRLAGLKASVYLAEAGQGLEPDAVESYDLGHLALAGRGLEHLPKIAYIYQIYSFQFRAVQNEPIFYGGNVLNFLPTIVHPNEILDGAVLKGFSCLGQETYSIQNHAMIRELYRRHGRELCFVGVVLTVAQFTEPERERGVVTAAKLAKTVLGADGAILTKIGGGAPHVQMAQVCERCEELGVKTTLVAADVSADETSGSGLLFNTPNADAIVNIGAFARPILLPPVEKVIGGPVTLGNNKSAEEEIILPTTHNLCGAVNQLGASRLTTCEY